MKNASLDRFCIAEFRFSQTIVCFHPVKNNYLVVLLFLVLYLVLYVLVLFLVSGAARV